MTTQQRRGLGRGLGSLIPTAPVPDEANTADTASGEPAATAPGSRAGSAPTDWIGRIDTAPRAADGEGGAADGESPGVAETTSSQVSAPVPVDGAHFAEIPVDDIRPNPRQPRQVFEEEALAELVASITEVGLLQPVVVRATPATGGYELVMGERRWRATQRAGLAAIPAIVRDTTDDDLLRDALLENLHRAQLNPLEEAAAYEQLLEDFGCTQEELSRRIGRSRPQISNTLRLLKLSPAVQRRVAAGVLSAGHARALVSVAEAGAQDRLAERVVAEGISVRALEEIVAVGDYVDGADEAVPRQRRAKPVAPHAAEVASRLSDLYDTRVKVDLGQRKGRITIEFASLGDLERIVALMEQRQVALSTE